MAKFYRAKHILLEEADDIDYIKDQFESGKSFEELAHEFSECETALKGGDLGRFAPGVMDAAFERALYQMEPGEIKYGVKTKFGHHIIKLLDKS